MSTVPVESSLSSTDRFNDLGRLKREYDEAQKKYNEELEYQENKKSK